MSHLNYNQKVIDEFKDPQNMGEIKDPDGHGMVGNAACGDIMEIFLQVEDDRITDIKAKTFGCVAAIATTSMLTKMVKGKTLDEAMSITKKQIIAEFGDMPPIKEHCSLLGLDALHKAIEDYKNRH